MLKIYFFYRSHFSSLCYPSSSCQGYRRFLPKVRRWGCQEGDQGNPRSIWPYPPRCWSPSLWTQEGKYNRFNWMTFSFVWVLRIDIFSLLFLVRWSRCSCPFPKVLPLKKLCILFFQRVYCWPQATFFWHNLVDFFYCSK